MTKFDFEIVRNARQFRLIQDGETIADFPTEAVAMGVAIRFAQENDALYTIHFPRRAS